MAEVNDGVGIIIARMESHPEEFFGVSAENNKWRWIFSENLREVMTEPEKAAIYEGMKNVRRLEITAKAIATVMPKDEEEYDPYSSEKESRTAIKSSPYWGGAVPKPEGKRIK
jgi:hypothetical protein